MTKNQKNKKFMFDVQLKIVGERYISSAWYAGDDAAEAQNNAIQSVANHKGVSVDDITVIKCELAGDYDFVMRNLMNDNS